MTDALIVTSNGNGLPTAAEHDSSIKDGRQEGTNGAYPDATHKEADTAIPLSSEDVKAAPYFAILSVLLTNLWFAVQQLTVVSTLLLHLQLKQAAQEASKPAVPVANRLADSASLLMQNARVQVKEKAFPWIDSACSRWEALGTSLSTILIFWISKPFGAGSGKLLHCFFMELWMAGFFLCRWRRPSDYIPTDDESVRLLGQLQNAPTLILQSMRDLPGHVRSFGSATISRCLQTLFFLIGFARDLTLGALVLLVPQFIQNGLIWIWACSVVALELLTNGFRDLRTWLSGLGQRGLAVVNSRVATAVEPYRERYQGALTAVLEIRQQSMGTWMRATRERVLSNEYVQFIWTRVQILAHFCYDTSIVILVLPISGSFLLVQKLWSFSVSDCLAQLRTWPETALTTVASLPSRFGAFLSWSLETLLFPFYRTVSLGRGAVESVKPYFRSVQEFYQLRVRDPLTTSGGLLSQALVEQFQQGGLLGLFEFLIAQLRHFFQTGRNLAAKKSADYVTRLVATWHSLGTSLFYYAFLLADLWIVRDLLAFFGLNKTSLTAQSMKLWMYVPSALGIWDKHIE